ncbi:MAG: tetratricopeptide repeat protein [Gemmatimonadaceae bacterium]
MSKAAQRKRKAAEFEQKRQYDRALPAYVQAIEASAGIPDELDIPLYNRVGDLHLRLGKLDQAVSYYETAVDLYAEGGFFNNAIALCNKVLRHAPGRSVIYYKLGKISARKGFTSDAKQNFLEYASRMERGGDITEAFRALKEFADLCPGEDDVRLMLAEQLARAGWTDEALDQLQTVYEAMLADDRTVEAAATLQRIRTLDPTFEPRTGRSRREEKREGLVFIDVDYSAPSQPASAAAAGVEGLEPTSYAAAEARPLTAERFGEVELPAPADVRAQRTLDESPLAGLTPLEDPLITLAAEAEAHGAQISGIERTSFDAMEPSDATAIQPLGVEHTSFDVVSPVTLGREVAAEENSVPAAEPAEGAGPAQSALEPIVPPAPLAVELGLPESLGDTVTGYLASLSSDVGQMEGGLPDDLALLPPEAVAEEQGGAFGGMAPSGSDRTDDHFVDLNEWLLETEQPRNPRMTGDDESQSGDSVQTDFSQMLETFKRGVAQNVDDADLDSHYDLGVAYMEMGLLDEAITQFQRVMRGDATPERRVRAYESLGQSFIEKGDHGVAIDSLRGALAEPGLNDTKLVGVLYLLGYASERLDRWPDAEGYYRRVFAVDIHFRDIGERLKRAEQLR